MYVYLPMARKNRNCLEKKQKRKDRRKIKRSLRKIRRAAMVSNIDGGSTGTSNVVARNNQQSEFQADQRPSTSQNAKKHLSPKSNNKRSPWKNAGGKFNRFKKIVDQSRRFRRSVYLVTDNQTRRKITPQKGSPLKKVCKRLINTSNSRTKKKLVHKRKSKDVTATLEEGEIRSVIDQFQGNISTDTSRNEDEDDDCIVIEPTLEEITLDDDNDEDDIPSTSDISTNYQSLINSFRERISSTPCQLKKSSSCYASVVKNSNNDDSSNEGNNEEENLPFFVDVGRRSGIESINSTDNFIDYTKFSILKENSHQKRRTVRLKQKADNDDDDDEVIDLDSSSYNTTNSTLKRKSRNLNENKDDDDDSVIFISEINKNDFIPINDTSVPPHKILKLSDGTPSTPADKFRTNILFTRSETKKLNQYNENAYNPSANEELTTGKRMVIIDGSNVAFKHGLDQTFSVKGLKIAIEYFEKMGHEVKAVIPQFRMNKGKSTDWEELERLHKAGKIVQTPCKNLPGLTSASYDDRFVLQLAFELDAAIVSNDNYRDLLHENPAFNKIIKNRVVGYTWCNDIFILPKDPYGKWGPNLHTILNRC